MGEYLSAIFVGQAADPSLWSGIERLGVVGLLVYIVIGAQKDWWVSGPRHRRVIARLEAERDRAMALNEANAEATQRALEVALQRGAKVT
jgi:hypothetical protein